MNKCQPLPLGIAIGVLWAAYAFLAGLAAMLDWGVPLVEVMGSFYLGYEASFFGGIIGALWGFLDGFIAGLVIAWIYNRVAKPVPSPA